VAIVMHCKIRPL